MRKLILILGIPIDDLTMAEALARIEQMVARGRATHHAHQIATVNADFVVKAMHDPELQAILQEADMATADGMPLVWGARQLGLPLEGRVTGADMVPALAERAAEKGYSLYFLGAAPGVAAQAAAILQERHPNLKIAGVLSPPKGDVLEMDDTIVAAVRQANPDILLVAFGNPKQEKWIAMHRKELPVPVMIGVGGTFDFIAGKIKRAPEWMQKAGLEWVWRLLSEPRRLWKRYVVDMVGFGSFFVRQWWVMRQGNKPALLLPDTGWVMVNDTAILNVQGRLDSHSHKTFLAKGQEALLSTPRLVINLGKAEFVDSTGMGALVGLHKQARDKGGELVLAAASEPVSRALTLLRLDRLFAIQPDVAGALRYFAQQPALEPVAPPVPQSQWTVLPMPRRLDAESAAAFLTSGEQCLQQNTHLVLDFTQTIFMTSAGLAALAKLQRQAQSQQGELRLASCSLDVRRTLELVRFDKLFTMFADVQAAVA